MFADPNSGRRKRAGLGLALLLVAGPTAACDQGGRPLFDCPTRGVSPGPGLAIAVGGRSNSPAPNMIDEIVTATNTVMEQRKTVTFIRVDGRPTVACAIVFNSDAGNPTALDNDKRTFRAIVEEELGDVRALEPEADPLAALDLAASTAGPGGTVVLIDSGLQTSPPMNFTKNDLWDTATPDYIVGELRRFNALPDLTTRRVILAGIGYTAPPQAPMEKGDRDKLVRIWQAIAVAGGAEEVVVNTAAATNQSPNGVPNVTEVPLRIIEFGCNKTIELHEGVIEFVPDTAIFVDPTAADEVLSDVVAFLANRPNASVRLVGSIAHVQPERHSGGLSQQRAEAVRDALRRLGVTNPIEATGEGWGPYPNKTHPNPSEAEQQRNRRVALTILC